jgi:hypothetical protein
LEVQDSSEVKVQESIEEKAQEAVQKEFLSKKRYKKPYKKAKTRKKNVLQKKMVE